MHKRLGADFIGGRVEGIEPWKVLAVEKLDRRELREKHETRLRHECPALAHERVEARVKALKARAGIARQRLVQPGSQE